MPPTAPNVDMITDSQRTIDRNCWRVCPTARRRPSSRVRSWIDSDSVLAIPISAMTMARASSTYTRPRIMLMPCVTDAAYCLRSSTVGPP